VVVLGVWLLLAGVAHAQMAPGPAPPGPDAAAAPRRSRLYISASVGLGGMHDDLEGSFGFVDGKANGASLGSDVVVGALVRPDLVVAGTVSLDWVQEPEVVINDRDVSDTVSVGVLFSLGALVDFALQPHGSGFHFRGGLAFSRLAVEDESGAMSDHTPSGLSILLGAGYEWRVSPQWGVGAMLRMVSAFIEDQNISHRLLAGSLAFAVSYR